MATNRPGPDQTEAATPQGDTVLDEVQQVFDATEQQFAQVVAPIRKNVFQRFPIISILAVTLGVTATVLGMERILLEYEVLQAHPFLIFAIGIGLLALTGALYKKLG